MAHSLICVGECMVELSPLAEDGHFAAGFAGDTFNTAWYARRLMPADWDVEYLTAVGDDASSDAFVSFAEDAGLKTEAIQRIPGATIGLYMVHLDNGERSFSYWRNSSAARRLADDPAQLDARLSGGDCIYVSGITVAILPDAGRERLFAALQQARGQGARIAFDPNLRPRLWDSTDQMCAEIARFGALSDIALPSFEDEASYFGDASPAATLARYQGYGVGLVVVKNGAEDVLVSDGATTETVNVVKGITPVDTTAAGDSFNGGFLSAYLTGSDVRAAVEQAATVAAQVVQGYGALVDITKPPRS